ncbi:hypothetical protein G9A89_008731 [Geosiphon pyriformis]|nr:hypothetical protein G9A89_008731 [Geosiphon pyriformis]
MNHRSTPSKRSTCSDHYPPVVKNCITPNGKPIVYGVLNGSLASNSATSTSPQDPRTPKRTKPNTPQTPPVEIRNNYFTTQMFPDFNLTDSSNGNILQKTRFLTTSPNRDFQNGQSNSEDLDLSPGRESENELQRKEMQNTPQETPLQNVPLNRDFQNNWEYCLQNGKSRSSFEDRNSNGSLPRVDNSMEFELSLVQKFARKFQAMSYACNEVAIGFQHFKEALEDMEEMPMSRIGHLVGDVIEGLDPISVQRIKSVQDQKSPENALSIPKTKGTNDHLNPSEITLDGFTELATLHADYPTLDLSPSMRDIGLQKLGQSLMISPPSPVTPIPVKVAVQPIQSEVLPKVPQVSRLPGEFWTDKEREELNEEFIRCFNRRTKIKQMTYADIAGEILKLCPPDTFTMAVLSRMIGRYLVRFHIPKDPIICEAIQGWVSLQHVEVKS